MGRRVGRGLLEDGIRWIVVMDEVSSAFCCAVSLICNRSNGVFCRSR